VKPMARTVAHRESQMVDWMVEMDPSSIMDSDFRISTCASAGMPKSSIHADTIECSVPLQTVVLSLVWLDIQIK